MSMVKKPFPLVPAKNSNTYLYVFSYAGDPDDFAADKALYNTELEKHLLYSPAIAENGIDVTGTDLIIGAVTTQRTIALASGVITTDVKHPIVLYKGNPIPFSDYDNGGIQTGTPQITLKLLTTTTYPSITETDYRVWFTDNVLGIVTAADVGGVSLPVEENEFKALGHTEPVLKTLQRGNPESTGSITVISNMTSILFDTDTSPVNNAGEDLMARIYGSDWTPNGGFSQRSKLTFPTDSFGICLLMVSGAKVSQPVAGTGKLWAVARFIYNCEISGVNAPENVDADSTDPVLQTIEFTSRFEPETTSIVI